MSRTILITGVTGKQGGAVARILAGNKDFKLRGMTRKPDSDAAKAMAALGVEIFQGDFDDLGTISKALTDVWGVFAVQNTWEAGVEKEEVQGKALAKISREMGVQHYVYASVGSAHLKTKIPHFENKFRIEETVRGLNFPTHVVIRPVFFMENLTSPWFLNDGVLAAAMKPETKLQMIAVQDIGKIGAAAFTDSTLHNTSLDIAGDAVTIPEAADILSKGMNKPITFKQLPIEPLREQMADFATMLEWFDSTGYSADIPALDKRFGGMTKLTSWASK